MIEVKSLSKQFALGFALRDVSFVVPSGEVCGLIGSNGAGKTTLLRILATVLPPGGGAAAICGLDVRRAFRRLRRRIGYMPDTFGGYEELRVEAYLELFAHIFDLPPETRARTIADILRLVDLLHLRFHAISRLSLGARQRLALGRVLLHNPDVLLLDEPVTGLDPVARVEMRALLRELGRMGKTVLISSHILADLADICGQLIILEKGQSIFQGTLPELRELVFPGRLIEVVVEGPASAVADFLRRRPWAASVRERGEGVELSLLDGVSLSSVSQALFAEGFRIKRFCEREPDLEEIFIRISEIGKA